MSPVPLSQYDHNILRVNNFSSSTALMRGKPAFQWYYTLEKRMVAYQCWKILYCKTMIRHPRSAMNGQSGRTKQDVFASRRASRARATKRWNRTMFVQRLPDSFK